MSKELAKKRFADDKDLILNEGTLLNLYFIAGKTVYE